ncbi:hypothetical protein HZS_1559 [Henneguya salminicola]|nr:hypothetical protein HZS_1559 [Henneguya salminicola]
MYCLMAMQTVYISRSKRGKEKLNHEGHFYPFDQIGADRSKKFWRCELKNECKVCLHTTVNNLVRMQINQHSPGSDAAQLQVAKIMGGIKRRATGTTQIPSVILNAALQKTSTAVQAKIPNKDAIRKVIQQRKNKNKAEPPQPTDRASIIIPDTNRFYEVPPGRMEEFILWDSGEQDEARIHLIGLQSNREWSHQIEKLYVDGTFSLAPRFFIANICNHGTKRRICASGFVCSDTKKRR